MGNYDFTLDLDTINTMSIIANWITERSRILEFGPANGRLTKYLSEEKHCVLTIVEIDEASGREAGQYAEKSFLGKEKGDIDSAASLGIVLIIMVLFLNTVAKVVAKKLNKANY